MICLSLCLLGCHTTSSLQTYKMIPEFDEMICHEQELREGFSVKIFGQLTSKIEEFEADILYDSHKKDPFILEGYSPIGQTLFTLRSDTDQKKIQIDALFEFQRPDLIYDQGYIYWGTQKLPIRLMDLVCLASQKLPSSWIKNTQWYLENGEMKSKHTTEDITITTKDQIFKIVISDQRWFGLYSIEWLITVDPGSKTTTLTWNGTKNFVTIYRLESEN